MCGIVGVLSNHPNNQGWNDRRDFFTQALFADTLRGFHSTGLMCFDKRDEAVWTHKKAVPAYDLIDMKSYEKIMRDMDNYNFIIGHNRAATRGKVNVDNAHPFHIGNIVGVHNGTISNQHALADGNKFTVDSQAIFNNINEEGGKETIEKIQGAFALVWWDLEDERLHIARNDDRPLNYAITKDKKHILIASEWMMIPWIAARNKIQIDDVCGFESGYEYMFKMGDITNFEKEKRTLKKPTYSGTGYSTGGVKVTDTRGGRGNGNRSATGNEVGRNKLKGDHLLRANGYKKYDAVDLHLFEFFPYGYNMQEARGKAIGCTEDPDIPNVIVHNLTEEEFRYFRNKKILGSVVSACYEIDYMSPDPNSAERVETLIVDGNSVVEITNDKDEHEDFDDDSPWVVGEDGVIRGNFHEPSGKAS